MEQSPKHTQPLLLITMANTSKDLIGSSCSNDDEKASSFPLNDLPRLLIEEILLRLPTFKSAFLCKCVCKYWYSLISTPYFARRFIAHHSNHRRNQYPSTLLINYLSKEEDYDYRCFTVSDEPMFKSRGFELDFLPTERQSAMVAATYKDLMLCIEDWGLTCFEGWLCNPFTNQLVILPSCELDSGFYDRIGFVCEPYYFEDSQGECTLDSNYRFRVVLMYEDRLRQDFWIWTYCSEIQKWNKLVLGGGKYGWYDSNVVAYNGKVLWCNNRDRDENNSSSSNSWSIFAFDPFNPELSSFIDCSYIHSTRFLDGKSFYYIGVCKGFLRMMQLVGWDTPQSLAIWELKDVSTAEWRLEDKIFLDVMVPESSSVHEIVDRNCLQPLGFHPSDGDVVYLHFDGFIISCSMRTRELKKVVELPCLYVEATYSSFHCELPLWPTPILQ